MLLRRLRHGGGRGESLLFPPPCHKFPAASFVDAKVKWVRDRGLDHAVEKEKHLRPLHALKNLLLQPPLEGHPIPSSLPLSVIAERSDELRLPFRAIRFIRKYPSAFIEEAPSPELPLRRPAILPTPELVRIHEEEELVYQSARGETADRLLRLLMLTPYKRLPLDAIHRLRWDLGLPDNFARSLLPEYPDYFQIVPSASGRGGSLDLELVCWKKELALSAMEVRAMKTGGYKKGDSLSFPMQFPRGYDMEKKVRRWVDDWQRLPYLSPYEDAGRCVDAGSDLAEKWTVAVLHELLSLLIGKKAEKDDLVLLGECVGLRLGFKKAILHYPGIFYQSNKNRAHTVLLREAYKRDILVEKHPLIGTRFQYIRLMRRSAAMDAATAPGHGAGRRRRGEKNAAADFVGDGDASRDEEEDDDDDEEEDEEDLSEETHRQSISADESSYEEDEAGESKLPLYNGRSSL